MILKNWSIFNIVFSVCQKLKAGAVVLVDMSSPTVGPLLRSFARAHGLVLTTVMDDSILLPVDKMHVFSIKVLPPGIEMLNVVADIVNFEKFDKVVILYDKSFGMYSCIKQFGLKKYTPVINCPLEPIYNCRISSLLWCSILNDKHYHGCM